MLSIKMGPNNPSFAPNFISHIKLVLLVRDKKRIGYRVIVIDVIIDYLRVQVSFFNILKVRAGERNFSPKIIIS